MASDVSMSEASAPTVDLLAQGSHISVRAAPDALFLRLWKEQQGEIVRRMFVELSVGEAISLRRELGKCIRQALAARTPV